MSGASVDAPVSSRTVRPPPAPGHPDTRANAYATDRVMKIYAELQENHERRYSGLIPGQTLLETNVAILMEYKTIAVVISLIGLGSLLQRC